MIHDEYTDDDLNERLKQKHLGIGAEKGTIVVITPWGRQKYKDANWMI